MRIQEMFYLVNHALETWVEPEFSELKKDGRTVGYSCKNAPQIVALLEPLRPFQEIEEQIEIIYSTDNTFRKGVVGDFTSREASQIMHAMSNIEDSLATIQRMCETLGVEAESSGFDIKLPPNITLSELADCTKDLNIVFSQCPLLQSDGEQIKLRGVDVGSSWLTFTIIGDAVANLITHTMATIVGKVNALRAQALKLKQYEEVVKQTEYKTELLKQIVETNTTVMKDLTNKAAHELAQERDITDPEDIERIRVTLDLLRDWTDKGMAVYAAIAAPEEIRAEFPSLETQAFSDFAVKRLEAHNNEEG